MTYRGVVTNGVIVLQDEGTLADGTMVEITPLPGDVHSLAELSAFGLWRDRGDMSDSAKASLDLRARLEQRSNNG